MREWQGISQAIEGRRGRQMEWLADIQAAIKAHDGEASLPHIYDWIEKHRGDLPVSWKEAVRATIYHQSSDSTAFVEGNPDVFRRTGRGVWGLRHPQETIPGRSPDRLFDQVISEITMDELASAAGDKNKLRRMLDEKIARRKRQFGMS